MGGPPNVELGEKAIKNLLKNHGWTHSPCKGNPGRRSSGRKRGENLNSKGDGRRNYTDVQRKSGERGVAG